MAKFRVTMKSPDMLEDAIYDAATDISMCDERLSEAQKANLYISERDMMIKECQKWFEYSECLTVEVDTDAGTCVVVPCY